MKPTSLRQQEFKDFYLPFGGKLKSSNRWVVLADQIPWDEFEDSYASHFAASGQGAPAFSVRVALGALIIKEKLQLSDEEAVQQIEENPYLQYFLGFSEYQNTRPFDSSMYVHFRKRLGEEALADYNDVIVKRATGAAKESEQDEDDAHPPPTHKGKLLIDATCAPADIAYPTDLGLLNEAREKTESIIDALHAPSVGKTPKPRTYRIKARKQYLAVAKMKSPGQKALRKAIRQQLAHVRRNLGTIEKLSGSQRLLLLSKRQYRDLLVISELHRQQDSMLQQRVHSVKDRIVSIPQPHIRPIIRGKAKAKTEFGAKLSASVVDGFAFADRISFDAYNESEDLPGQVEAFRQRYGHYPASVHADKIYCNRSNRAYCKELGIRLSGPRLGRPRKITEANKDELKSEKQQQRKDEIDRIPVEGKFGQGKRRFGLGLIKSRLAETTKSSIHITFIVMNLEKWLRAIFHALISAHSVIAFQARDLFKALWNVCTRPLAGVLQPSGFR